MNMTPIEMLQRLKAETSRPYWDDDQDLIDELFGTLRTALEEYEEFRRAMGQKPSQYWVEKESA